MSAIILHGVEVKLLPNTTAPIATGNESVVGLIGDAPNSEGSKAATLTLGSGNAQVVFTADAAGAAGNRIAVEVVRGEADSTLAISVSDSLISVTLTADASGVITSTADEVVAALNSDSEAAALVAASAGGGDGSATFRPYTKNSLSGGQDEPFPLNTPVLLKTSAEAHALGKAGGLPAGIADAWRTSGKFGCLIVAVRIASGDAAALQAAAVANIPQFKAAESATGYKPRLLAAPGLSHTLPVAQQLVTTGKALGALAIVDTPVDSFNAAVTFAGNLDKAYAVYPSIKIYDATAGDYSSRPPSALVAGHLARVDWEEGWHNSPSNRLISNVVGSNPAVEFDINNPQSTANLLNQQFITTLVKRQGGTYLWGNRLTDGTLITHYRVERIMSDAVALYVADWVDRNVDVPFVDFILRKINQFLSDQIGRGILTGGRAWFDPAKNTATSLSANRVTFSIELGIANVAEHVIIEQRVSGAFNEQLIQQLTQLGGN